MFISSIHLQLPKENQSGQQDLQPLLWALSSGNLNEFSNLITKIDIDNYFNYEGEEILISAFLFGFVINPDVENGEQFIREILAQHPNFDLPIANDGSTENITDVLIAIQEDLLNETNQVTSMNIFMSRIQIILNAILEKYTESDSRIGGWQGGALNLDRALASAEAAQPERLGDAGGSKLSGCPTTPEPILESRAV